MWHEGQGYPPEALADILGPNGGGDERFALCSWALQATAESLSAEAARGYTARGTKVDRDENLAGQLLIAESWRRMLAADPFAPCWRRTVREMQAKVAPIGFNRASIGHR